MCCRFFENTTTCDSAKESIFMSYTSNVCITGGDYAYSVDCSDGTLFSFVFFIFLRIQLATF